MSEQLAHGLAIAARLDAARRKCVSQGVEANVRQVVSREKVAHRMDHGTLRRDGQQGFADPKRSERLVQRAWAAALHPRPDRSHREREHSDS